MSQITDNSQIMSVANQVSTAYAILDCHEVDVLSVSVTTAAYTTQSAAVMASATNVLAEATAIPNNGAMNVGAGPYTGDVVHITGFPTDGTKNFTYVASITDPTTQWTTVSDLIALMDGLTDIAAVSAGGTTITISVVTPGTSMNTVGSAPKITATGSFSSLNISFSGGVDGGIFTKTAHGLLTGTVGQMTTSSALPTGLSAVTNYWIINLSANTFALASSLANALVGTKILFTSKGTGNQTFTATAGSSTVALYESSNGTNFLAIAGATDTSGVGTAIIHVAPVYPRYIKVLFTPVSGAANFTVNINARDNSITSPGNTVPVTLGVA